MKLNRPQYVGLLTAGVVATLGLVTHAQPPSPQPAPKSNGRPSAMTDAQADQLAMEAYVYAYPLVTMEMTRRQSTNVAKPEATRAPMGQFANLKKYPDASFRGVTAPNADTLYSAAWLDLAKEPMVLELPEEGKRFYMMPMLDGWTNVFADPGTRTSGTKPQKYVITGPRFSGAIPAGLTEIKSPTALVWILGRTYSSGTPADYKQVNALQDQYKLTPLSAYGKGGKFVAPMGKVDPSIDMKTAPREQVNAMSGPKYFELFASLLAENPPAPADKPMLDKLAKLGIVPGQPFDAAKLDPKLMAALDRVPKQAIAMIEKGLQSAPKVNGWVVDKTGKYGTDYPKRAMIAFFGLGANLPEDAIYPTATTDSENKPLDASSNNYVITFKSKEDLPPVRSFWSLTMYDKDFFFVKNPINRQTLSARDKLKANPDGTISLYIQNKSPGKDRESNWLPAPAGPFVLMMRLYWPTEQAPSILDGSWKPPGIERRPSAQAQVEPKSP